jgi:hypothetical protein
VVASNRQEYLIEFRSGGREFAAEARDLAGIAGADWRPPREADRRWVLAELMGLAAGQGQRTLLVARKAGACGFVVDAISKRPLQPQPILPVPDLLRDWLRIPALSGVLYRAGDRLPLQVLDLAGLADWASSRESVHGKEVG